MSRRRSAWFFGCLGGAALLASVSGCRTGSGTGAVGGAEGTPSDAARFRILLDPGHGGEDAGAVRDLLPEKELNLLLAREIRRELVRRGFQVCMTRDCDLTLSLRQRQILADALRPDLFVSVHHNAALSQAANGVECYIRTPGGDPARQAFWDSSFRAANAIQQAVVARLPGTADRGVKQARFAVLIPKRPAVLIEAGFISNPREALAIHSAERRRRFAEGVAEGILAYVTQWAPVCPGLPQDFAEAHHAK